MNLQNSQTVHPNKTSKKASKTFLASVAAAFFALLNTIAWFFPIVTHHGRSYTYLDVLNGNSTVRFENSDQERIGFWLFVVICGVLILLSVIQKKWAAITGAVLSALEMFACIGIKFMMSSQGLDSAFGGILLIVFSVLVFALSAMKLLFIRQDGTSATNSNPLFK